MKCKGRIWPAREIAQEFVKRDIRTIAPAVVARIDAAQHAITAKLFLPVSNCKIETVGEVVYLRLDSLNAGNPLVLLIDRRFWYTLRSLSSALHIENNVIMLSNQNLARIVTARFEDYYSVRLRARQPGLADYRANNIEVRKDEKMHKDETRLRKQYKRNLVGLGHGRKELTDEEVAAALVLNTGRLIQMPGGRLRPVDSYKPRATYFGQKLIQPFDDVLDNASDADSYIPAASTPKTKSGEDEDTNEQMAHTRNDLVGNGVEVERRLRMNP